MAEANFSEAGFNASYNKKESIKYGIILGVIVCVLIKGRRSLYQFFIARQRR